MGGISAGGQHVNAEESQQQGQKLPLVWKPEIPQWPVGSLLLPLQTVWSKTAASLMHICMTP